ncbi:hypothetical protein BC629DRAFT_1445160 [Irpex lacteus]|nr:hypothetical protein BC629DRAFT_1445160 [Irpex lacteus]
MSTEPDAAYEALHLKPPPALPVAEFLKIQAPRRPGSRKIALEVNEWFSTHQPTSEMSTIDSLLLPHTKLCSVLDSALAEAIRDHVQSVQHPTKDGVYLPLSTIRAWKWGDLIRRHLRRAEAKYSESKSTARSLAVRGLTSTSKQRRLKQASSKWLDDDVIDAALDTVRQEKAMTNTNDDVDIASTLLAYHVSEGIKNSSTGMGWGRRLQQEIDLESRFISIGDSMPMRRLEEAKERLLDGLKSWLKTYLPDYAWAVNKNGLPIRGQQDGYSCGIATINAIHRRVIPTAPVWSPWKPRHSRTVYYERCIVMGSQSPTTPRTSSPPEPPKPLFEERTVTSSMSSQPSETSTSTKVAPVDYRSDEVLDVHPSTGMGVLLAGYLEFSDSDEYCTEDERELEMVAEKKAMGSKANAHAVVSKSLPKKDMITSQASTPTTLVAGFNAHSF